MFTTIMLSSIHVLDQDEALDFYVGTLGLEVCADQDLGFMRWLTVRVPGDPDRQLLLERPGQPLMDDATAERVRELVTKGATGGWISLRTDDAHKAYAELEARGVELLEEPTERPYGTDFGLRDPFGNLIRVVQPNGVHSAVDVAAHEVGDGAWVRGRPRRQDGSATNRPAVEGLPLDESR